MPAAPSHDKELVAREAHGGHRVPLTGNDELTDVTQRTGPKPPRDAARMIQVRNVPDRVHQTLKTRAAAAGMSLSDYIKRDLEEAAGRPSLEEIDARVAARGRSGLRTATVLAALRDAREN